MAARENSRELISVLWSGADILRSAGGIQMFLEMLMNI